MIKATVGDLAKHLVVDYATAGALVKLMVSMGKGREVGKRPTPTGRGKPATIYELNQEFSISLDSQAENEPVYNSILTFE